MGPKLTQAYLNYAVLLQRRKSFLPARELLDQALTYDPKNADIYFNRGVISEALNQNQQAIQDYTKAIELAPKGGPVYYKRAQLFQLLQRDQEAVRDYEIFIKLIPDHAMAQNNMAWILATSADPAVRNGEEALAHAQRANRLLGSSERYDFLDTLAAAHAENRQFNKAVEFQIRAIQQAPDQAKTELNKRLNLYKSGKPYREKKPE